MNHSDKSVLIIGGAGYIGSVLSRMFLANGTRVRVLDNLLYGNGSSLSDLISLEEFSFHRGDFCDEATLTRALDGVSDVVLLAALVGDPICKKYEEEARRVNLAGTMALYDALRASHEGRFVFVSTCSNYGLMPEGTLATEESELNPLSLYAEAKVAMEQHILSQETQGALCPTILRFATAFGTSHRMRFDLTVSEFTRIFALGREFLVYDENTWRPYCHVRDISRAIMTVLAAPAESVASQVFNVGDDDENYTKKMLVDLIRESVPDCQVKYKEGGFDPRNYRVNFEKIHKALGFSADFSVRAEVPRLIHAVRQGIFDDVESRKNFYGNYHIDLG